MQPIGDSPPIRKTKMTIHNNTWVPALFDTFSRQAEGEKIILSINHNFIQCVFLLEVNRLVVYRRRHSSSGKRLKILEVISAEHK